ncbi:MAG TPA: hypothetical protein VI168_07255, partial [Croceibacterium sp.]
GPSVPDGRIRPRTRRHPGFDHGPPIARPNYVTAALFLTCVASAMVVLQRARTHAVVIDVPAINGFSPAPELWPPGTVVHGIGITPANEILWNGKPVTQTELLDRLEAVKRERPRPGILFWPEPQASYDLSVKLLGVLAAAGVTQERFCLAGLGRHGVFGKEGRPVPDALPKAAPACGPASLAFVPLVSR